MTNYIIRTENFLEHYFYKPYQGICMRRQSVGGIFGEACPVIASGGDAFTVYAENERVHLACIDSENRLVYAVRKEGVWKKYILSKMNADIFVSDMRLYTVGGRLNLLYSALYSGETLLIHCIFAERARPSTVATLEASHFVLYNGRVYFTNTDSRLGYADLSDEKPAQLTPLYDNAHCVAIGNLSGRELLIFTRDSRLYINGEEQLYDSRMEMPVFVRGADRAYIMWKSGSFIRYIASFNGGVTWSDPMRFMSTGVTPTLYTMQEGNSFNLYYGYPSDKEITLLGAPDIFSSSADFTFSGELEKTKAQLHASYDELSRAKEEIARLNKLLKNINFPSKNS